MKKVFVAARGAVGETLQFIISTVEGVEAVDDPAQAAIAVAYQREEVLDLLEHHARVPVWHLTQRERVVNPRVRTFHADTCVSRFLAELTRPVQEV